MNKKFFSNICICIGMFFLILSFVFPIIDEAAQSAQNDLRLDMNYFYYNQNGGVYMYMTLAGIVMLIGGLVMQLFEKVFSIILSFVGIDLFFLPIFLTLRKISDISIIGGVGFPTFWLHYAKSNGSVMLIISLIGLAFIAVAFIMNVKLTKKQ